MQMHFGNKLVGSAQVCSFHLRYSTSSELEQHFVLVATPIINIRNEVEIASPAVWVSPLYGCQ